MTRVQYAKAKRINDSVDTEGRVRLPVSAYAARRSGSGRSGRMNRWRLRGLAGRLGLRVCVVGEVDQ